MDIDDLDVNDPKFKRWIKKNWGPDDVPNWSVSELKTLEMIYKSISGLEDRIEELEEDKEDNDE